MHTQNELIAQRQQSKVDIYVSSNETLTDYPMTIDRPSCIVIRIVLHFYLTFVQHIQRIFHMITIVKLSLHPKLIVAIESVHANQEPIGSNSKDKIHLILNETLNIDC